MRRHVCTAKGAALGDWGPAWSVWTNAVGGYVGIENRLIINELRSSAWRVCPSLLRRAHAAPMVVERFF
ncbi:MAG: hypothetical protein IPM54_00555 [Polyangiaceae bacterium]|nr:hypothetical protein [Polyangiaceae bacterium]